MSSLCPLQVSRRWSRPEDKVCGDQTRELQWLDPGKVIMVGGIANHREESRAVGNIKSWNPTGSWLPSRLPHKFPAQVQPATECSSWLGPREGKARRRHERPNAAVDPSSVRTRRVGTITYCY